MYATLGVVEALTPATIFEFPPQEDEPVLYTATCLAARGENGLVQNLSLTQLGNVQFIAWLREKLPKGERAYYAPTVAAMSGAILPHKSFTDFYTIDRFRHIARPGYIGTTNDRLPCDGTIIGRNDGFIMSAGGCPLIVLTGVGEDGSPICIAAHAGRHSLLDPFALSEEKTPREHFSVVTAMVTFARNHYQARPEDLILRSFFSLPMRRYPHDPRDPQYREKSQRLHECLRARGLGGALLERDDGVICLSLSELIRLQAQAERVGKIDTARLTLPEDGNFAYTQHPRLELRGAVRNLVILTRE